MEAVLRRSDSKGAVIDEPAGVIRLSSLGSSDGRYAPIESAAVIGRNLFSLPNDKLLHRKHCRVSLQRGLSGEERLVVEKLGTNNVHIIRVDTGEAAARAIKVPAGRCIPLLGGDLVHFGRNMVDGWTFRVCAAATDPPAQLSSGESVAETEDGGKGQSDTQWLASWGAKFERAVDPDAYVEANDGALAMVRMRQRLVPRGAPTYFIGVQTLRMLFAAT